MIAITLIVVGAAIPIYGNFHSQSQTDTAADQLTQTIRTARQRSVSRLNNAMHGVYFSTTTYILFQGNSYTTRDIDYDRSTLIESSMAITPPGSFLGNEVTFSKSLGVPSATGTIVLNHDVSGATNIILNENGKVEAQ